MATEFTSKGALTDYWICFLHDKKRSAKNLIRKLLGRNKQPKFVWHQRYTDQYAKNVVRKKKLALTGREPSWFYTAFERDDADALTNYTLEFIEKNIKKESRILV